MDPQAPDLTPTPPPGRPAARNALDPVDRRVTAGLLSLLLGTIVGVATWTIIWPMWRKRAAPSPEALQSGAWPTNDVIIGSLLVMALWVALWIGFLYWALSRRKR